MQTLHFNGLWVHPGFCTAQRVFPSRMQITHNSTTAQHRKLERLQLKMQPCQRLHAVDACVQLLGHSLRFDGRGAGLNVGCATFWQFPPVFERDCKGILLHHSNTL